MRRFWTITAMAFLACSMTGCGTIAQTALGVPVMMAKVAEVPLHHTREMTRIAATAAADTTKSVAGEAIRAGASERIAAKNAQAQVQIAQIQAQQAQILAQQEQLRIQQTQMQAQLAQARAGGAPVAPMNAAAPMAEAPVATLAIAPPANVPSASVTTPPSLAAVSVSRTKSNQAIPAATVAATPAKPEPAPVVAPVVNPTPTATAAPVQLADASVRNGRGSSVLSFDEMRTAQRRAAMQRMAQMTPTWAGQP